MECSPDAAHSVSRPPSKQKLRRKLSDVALHHTNPYSTCYDQSQSPLFRLPVELRVEIWKHCFDGKLCIPFNNRLGDGHTFIETPFWKISFSRKELELAEGKSDKLPGLLLSCRLIYAEAIDILYESSQAIVYPLLQSPGFGGSATIYEKTAVHHRARFRKLKLDLRKWKITDVDQWPNTSQDERNMAFAGIQQAVKATGIELPLAELEIEMEYLAKQGMIGCFGSSSPGRRWNIIDAMELEDRIRNIIRGMEHFAQHISLTFSYGPHWCAIMRPQDAWPRDCAAWKRPSMPENMTVTRIFPQITPVYSEPQKPPQSFRRIRIEDHKGNVLSDGSKIM